MAVLDDRLDFVLGAKAADKLAASFGLYTVGDLIRHFPRKYHVGTNVRDDDEELGLEEGDHVTFVDEITGVESRYTRKPPQRLLLTVTLGRRRQKTTATFFNATYLKGTLVTGTRVMISGVVSYYRGTMQLAHPAFLVLGDPKGRTIGTKSMKSIAEAAGATGTDLMAEFNRPFFPIYPATSELHSWEIYSCVRQVLDVLDPVPDPLPEAVVRERGLMPEDRALRSIHLAENKAERDKARERLTFDEAVGLEWALIDRRYTELGGSGPFAPRRGDGLVAALLERLPFELTDGQREVLQVISAELAGNRPMNRMLQGEVGSGKTIVSVLAMLQMIDAGYQCALLAPTEVLAAQHARSITEVLGPLGTAGQLGAAETATRVTLLTGSMTAPQKRQVREAVATGQAGIVIGTHALLQDAVEFDNLGLVVVDEQHRFGVEQRDRLRAKARGDVTPHLLVMTATPIPRTVALTVFGDLETSTLRELPRGRQPITSNTVFMNEKRGWLERAWARIVEEVGAGRQAYVVASRIDETDKAGVPDADAEDKKAAAKPAQGGRRKAEKPDRDPAPPAVTVVKLFDVLRAGALAGLRLGLMHGRLPAEEKDAVMAQFRAGEIDVLVCTTVIEVGVDVPNATMMVVMDADRFGISQLHQLRGRIGRGEHPSLCLLVSQLPEGSRPGQRLKAVAATQDGFELADLDLRERREGDVLGLTQSGRPISLKFLSLQDHQEVIEAAREWCEWAYQRNPEDPGPARLAGQFTADRVEYLDKS